MENKRRATRANKKVKSEVADSQSLTFSTSQNISQGGIFISTPDPLTIGSEVSLSLYIPGEDPVKLKGVVRWTNENESPEKSCGMGIEFIESNEEAISTLKKYIG